jgi:hypothetical protein
MANAAIDVLATITTSCGGAVGRRKPARGLPNVTQWRQAQVTRITFLMLTALLSVSAAAQQSGSTTDTDPYGWKVNWVPFYLWMSGFNGNFGVRGHVTLVDASFSDVFDKLNIGYMTVSVC